MKLLALLFFLTFIASANETLPIFPLPNDMQFDQDKAHLGKQLFFDPILSKDRSVACSSCHQLPGSGTDNLRFSFGVNGQEGAINTPTVLNAVFNFVQFWDGRAKDLKEQASGPILNPIEMANTKEHAVLALQESPSYKEAFFKIYQKALSFEQITEVIAEFEKALTTPNSKFDRYLRGDNKVLSKIEKEGLELFVKTGCISCHNGINIGGNLYQKFGIFEPFVSEYNQLGRFALTHDEEDRYFFKVPSLRNIALTYPYLHDGSIKTLEKAVDQMLIHQLGIKMQTRQIDAIVSFLKTLTGDTPKILEP